MGATSSNYTRFPTRPDGRPSLARWAHAPPTSATQTAAAGAQFRPRPLPPDQAPNQRATPRPRRAPARWTPGAGACVLRALVRDSCTRQLPRGRRRRPRRPGARHAAGEGPRVTVGEPGWHGFRVLSGGREKSGSGSERGSGEEGRLEGGEPCGREGRKPVRGSGSGGPVKKGWRATRESPQPLVLRRRRQAATWAARRGSVVSSLFLH